MTASILPNPLSQFIDIDGNPLVGGTVEFYVANTLVPKDTWQDADKNVLNTNPVVLDARGQALIYGVGIYRQILRDSAGNLIWDQPTASPGGGGGGFGAQVSIASNTTTDLGSLNSNNVLITGTTTITSFGTSALLSGPVYLLEFANSLTITNNNTSMVLPNGVDIQTKAGDFALFMFTNVAGYWTLIEYFRKNGQPLSITGPDTAVSSNSTTDLGAVGTNLATITGTTTITSLGSSASTGNPLYFVKFNNSLTLTYNATSLILPGAKNIVTLANDFAIFEYLGSGNWECLSYTTPLDSSGELIKVETYATSGTFTWTKGTSCNSVIVDVVGAGGSGGGAGTSVNNHIMASSGGGAGAYSRSRVTSLSATYTITVGTGGAAPTAGANDGNAGTSSSFGTVVVCGGGAGGRAGTDTATRTINVLNISNGGTVSTAGNILSSVGSDGGGSVAQVDSGIGAGIAGFGAAGPFGGSGAGPSKLSGAGSATGGTPGTGPGSGGAGAVSASNGSANTASGGAGHDGLVVVYSYT